MFDVEPAELCPVCGVSIPHSKLKFHARLNGQCAAVATVNGINASVAEFTASLACVDLREQQQQQDADDDDDAAAALDSENLNPAISFRSYMIMYCSCTHFQLQVEGAMMLLLVLA